MERWLTQRLSAGLGAAPGRADGVCANVDFPSPRRLRRRRGRGGVGHRPRRRPVAARARGLAAARGRRRAPRRAVAARARRAPRRRRPSGAPLRRASATSPTCSTATRCTGRSSCARGPRRGRRVADDAAWQAELWRRLRDAHRASPDPAERLDARVRAPARASPGSSTCPPRLSLFGLTRLPAGHLDVLRALAAAPRRPPVPAAPVARAVGARSRGAAGAVVAPRATTRPRRCRANRLLASWGHDARELQLVLGARARIATTTIPVARPAATRCSPASRPTCARTARRRQPDERPPLDPADRSVQVHACHGRARQVEVAARRDPAPARRRPDARAARRDRHVPGHRDVRAADPGDVRRRRGRADDDDEAEALPPELRPPDLRVRLADRSLRQTNPVLGVVARLLELAERAADRLAGARPRRPRAGPPALPARRRRPRPARGLGRATSGIRWGLDAAHRAPFKLETLPSRAPGAPALDRVLLGVTMTEDEQRLFGGVLPLDDVDSGAIDLAGRFAELVDRLQRRARRARASRSRSPRGRAALGRRPPTRSTATAPRDAWQRAELQRLLDDVVAEAGRRTTSRSRWPRSARCSPTACGPPDARELPHRPPDGLHARADALGAAPRRLPARPRRRRRSRARRRATATT